MAKRKRKTNTLTNARRIKEGRGEGILENYKPWLHIQDVASKGLATRIKGLKTGRVHHFLSKLELECFYCFDWETKVFDIREQYPLYLPETLAIADQLNIKHPRVPVTFENVVMTTDFLVTVYDAQNFREIAITVKYSNHLENKRAVEKLEIERYYWTRRNIEWLILTEKQIKPILVKNIKWIHRFADLSAFDKSISPELIEKVDRFMSQTVFHSDTALKIVTAAADEKFDLDQGTSLTIVRHLIATKKWQIDMHRPLQPARPLPLINKQLKEVE